MTAGRVLRASLAALQPLLLVFLAPAMASAQPVAIAKADYVELARARAVADGSVLFGGDGLPRAAGAQSKGLARAWGPQGRDASGFGYVEVQRNRAVVNVITDGDERALALTARAVGKARSVRVLFGGKVIGDADLDGTWRTFTFPLAADLATAGGHELDLRRRKSGAAIDEGTDGAAFGKDTEVLLHAVHLLLAAPSGGAASAPAAGPSDPVGTLQLRAGERMRLLLPFAAGSELRVQQVSHRGDGQPIVRIDVTPEGGATETVGRIETEGGAWVLPGADGARVLQLDLVAEGPAGEVGLQLATIAAPPNPAPAALPEWQPPKNVLVWVIDTLRGDRLSHLNPDSPVKTPNLDALAAEGVTFVNAMQQGNFSKETACSLFTSTYNDLHECHKMQHTLPKTIPGMQEVLQAAGFATAGIVANGYVSKRWGYSRGWDAWHNYITTRGRLRGIDYDDTAFDWGRGRVRGVRGEAMTRDTGEWLRKLAEGDPAKRWFVYLQTIDPHTPYRPPREFWEPLVPYAVGKTLPVNPNNTGLYADNYNAGKHRFTEKEFQFFEALYLGEVAYTDFYFGKLIEALKARGMLDDTLIIVTADHGEGFRDHESVGHGILNLYEEVTRVPLIVRYPKYVPAGRRVEHAVEVMDIAPTIADAMGLAAPEGWQGASLLPALRGPEPLLPPPAFSTMSGFLVAAKAGHYKIVRWRDRAQPLEVYDVAADPKETRNLATERPWLTRYLVAWLDWYEAVSTTWKRAEKGAIGDFRPRGAASEGRAATPAGSPG